MQMQEEIETRRGTEGLWELQSCPV
jgi:hypothetical protein